MTIIFKKGTYLSEEIEYLLNAEFKEPKNYKLIFKAIALGYNRLGEICNYTGLDKSMVSKYLYVLCKLHILKEAESVLRELMGKSGFVDWIFEAFHRFFLPGIKNANTNVATKIINITKKDCFIAVCVAEYTILLNSFTLSSGYWDRSISACSASIFSA